MAKTFRCTIVTPSEAVFDDEVAYASFPAWDGQQGVMINQSPILVRLGIGPMRIELSDGTNQWFAVDGGFVQVQESVLTVLTERATRAEDISLEEAEAQLADANVRAVAGGENRIVVEAEQARGRTRRTMARASADRR